MDFNYILQLCHGISSIQSQPMVEDSPELSESPSIPETKHISRVWNKCKIKTLYTSARAYCDLHEKALHQLTLEDFTSISAEISQKPFLCMKKIREICETGSLSPGAWSEYEDEMLSTLPKSTRQKWGKIAKEINKSIYSGMKVRSGKQCKERWVNHLDPRMKKDKWTHEEDQILLKLYKSYGNKWCDISRILGNRTDSSIKNRIKSIFNKQKQELKTISDSTIGFTHKSESTNN